ncbi:hypothetical protein PM082_006978 [Marasmius tenuissimus]|nr:hypothetical protein PM082_006978 [Marasmius tenuissimus]
MSRLDSSGVYFSSVEPHADFASFINEEYQAYSAATHSGGLARYGQYPLQLQVSAADLKSNHLTLNITPSLESTDYGTPDTLGNLVSPTESYGAQDHDTSQSTWKRNGFSDVEYVDLRVGPVGGENEFQGAEPCALTVDRKNHRFRASRYDGLSYGQHSLQVQTTGADLNTGHSTLHLASSPRNTDLGPTNTSHRVPVSQGGFYGVQHDSQSTFGTDAIKQRVQFGGGGLQDTSYSPILDQKYKQTTAPYHGVTSSYSHRPPQVHASAMNFSMSEVQPGQRGTHVSARTRPTDAVGHIPDPSIDSNIRREVGSPAVTEASTARRKKGARYKCEVEECGSTFTSQANFGYHTLAHRGVKPYPCERCGRLFRSPHDRKRHGRRKTPCRPLSSSPR